MRKSRQYATYVRLRRTEPERLANKILVFQEKRTQTQWLKEVHQDLKKNSDAGKKILETENVDKTAAVKADLSEKKPRRRKMVFSEEERAKANRRMQ